MVSRSKEGTQCILQARCTECGSINDNYTVVDHEMSNSSIIYNIECECGETAVVRITPDGVTYDGNLSYANASWTSGGTSDDSEDDEEEEEENSRLESDAKNKQ